MIEIIDKINNTIKKVSDSLEIVIDPKGKIYHLEDYQIEGKALYVIIHKEDGSTVFLYKNPNEKTELQKKIEESDIFLVEFTEGYLNDIECLEQFLYAKFLKKTMVILEENNALKQYSKLMEGCDILLKLQLTKDEPIPEDLTIKIKKALQKRNRG